MQDSTKTYTTIEFNVEDIFNDTKVDSRYIDYESLGFDTVEYVVDASTKVGRVRVRAIASCRTEKTDEFPAKSKLDNLFMFVRNQLKEYVLQSVLEKAERELSSILLPLTSEGLLNLNVISRIEKE